MYNHAANTAVADEQVRAAPEEEERHFVVATEAQDGRQLGLVRRLNINLRRPADAQRGALGKWFIAPQHGRGREQRAEFRREVGGARDGLWGERGHGIDD